MVVGDLPEPGQAEAVTRWAIDSGWPVVAEPFSSAHGALPHGPLLLAAEDWLERHLPDRVITVGRVTLARPVARLLRNPSVRVEAVTADPAWADPSHVTSAVHGLGVLRAPVPTAGAGEWAAEWEQAGRAVAKAVADAAHPWPSGLAVAEAVGTSVAPGALLFLGSSNAVRDLDLATHPAGDRPAVVASRGLAGIDGCVSTAVGLALAGGGPTYALLGDLTFLHDANGLLIGPAEPRPDLTIVVRTTTAAASSPSSSRGSRPAADFERVFGTPTGTDLAALCGAHGVPHRVAATRDDLAAAVASDPAGCRWSRCGWTGAATARPTPGCGPPPPRPSAPAADCLGPRRSGAGPEVAARA